MSSSVHIENKNYILVPGIGLTQGLDDPILTVEAQYSKNLLRSNKIFCSSLHGNGSNSFLFVNASKKYQFKGNKSEKKYIYSSFLCYYHVTYEFQGKSTLYSFPECQGSPYSKQASYLNFK